MGIPDMGVSGVTQPASRKRFRRGSDALAVSSAMRRGHPGNGSAVVLCSDMEHLPWDYWKWRLTWT